MCSEDGNEFRGLGMSSEEYRCISEEDNSFGRDHWVQSAGKWVGAVREGSER
jgi:hypothetical protein